MTNLPHRNNSNFREPVAEVPPITSLIATPSRLLCSLIAACCLATLPAPARAQNHPVTIGVDTAGSYHIYFADIEYWNHDPWWNAIDELGADYINVHLYPELDHGDANATRTLEKILRIDAGMRAHGAVYHLNNEDANFFEVAEITPGVNEYDHPGGLHRWDLRREWLQPLADANASSATAFLGVVYDEPLHMQLEGNRYAYRTEDPRPPNSFDAPYLADTHGLSIPDAWQTVVDAATTLSASHYAGLGALWAEQLHPDGFHLFARAGWNITPKLLKESLSSVTMAVALGAAIQYQDRTRLWTLVDMHYKALFPGHSLEKMRSALLMAYWLGADAIYVENVDFPGFEERHPDAEPGALLRWETDDTYVLTPHGQVLREFTGDYLPAHPRTVDWRNYRPRVALVRLPDGDWGQGGLEPTYRDRLLGNRDHPSDAISREWLHVWPILTHDAVSSGAISYIDFTAYPDDPDQFFIPLDSVAVFDHTVTGPVLDSIECFVVCGHDLSPETFDAIAARVAAGATCIIARRLYGPHGDIPRPGNWLIVDSFENNPAIAETLAPFLGPPDVARFRFTDQIVQFRQGPTTGSMTVEVFDRTQLPQIASALVGANDPPPTPGFTNADLNADSHFDVADLMTLIAMFE